MQYSNKQRPIELNRLYTPSHIYMRLDSLRLRYLTVLSLPPPNPPLIRGLLSEGARGSGSTVDAIGLHYQGRPSEGMAHPSGRKMEESYYGLTSMSLAVGWISKIDIFGLILRRMLIWGGITPPSPTVIPCISSFDTQNGEKGETNYRGGGELRGTIYN